MTGDAAPDEPSFSLSIACSYSTAAFLVGPFVCDRRLRPPSGLVEDGGWPRHALSISDQFLSSFGELADFRQLIFATE
jgi:hypothetical protein